MLGWGRYETFEFGCTVAFHDPSFNVRSYVAFTMTTVMAVPLGKHKIGKFRKFRQTADFTLVTIRFGGKIL